MDARECHEVDRLIEEAYQSTLERLRGMEGNNAYRTLIMHNNYSSFLCAYLNYTMGCFEGLFFTRFLERYDRMTSPEENEYIKKAMAGKLEVIRDKAMKIGETMYDQSEK